ncbi:hypothetical protein JCM6882_001842 [Rhodosporidiobolus microsporus]
MAHLERPATPTKSNSRPSTPGLLGGQQARISRPGTPARGSRPGTPSRLQKDPNAGYLTRKGMPNNLELDDPRTQDRASDLLGMPGTESIKDPPTEQELEKVRELAARLDKKKK